MAKTNKSYARVRLLTCIVKVMSVNRRTSAHVLVRSSQLHTLTVFIELENISFFECITVLSVAKRTHRKPASEHARCCEENRSNQH